MLTAYTNERINDAIHALFNASYVLAGYTEALAQWDPQTPIQIDKEILSKNITHLTSCVRHAVTQLDILDTELSADQKVGTKKSPVAEALELALIRAGKE